MKCFCISNKLYRHCKMHVFLILIRPMLGLDGKLGPVEKASYWEVGNTDKSWNLSDSAAVRGYCRVFFSSVLNKTKHAKAVRSTRWKKCVTAKAFGAKYIFVELNYFHLIKCMQLRFFLSVFFFLFFFLCVQILTHTAADCLRVPQTSPRAPFFRRGWGKVKLLEQV